MTSVKPVDVTSTLLLACRARESGESVDVSTEPFGPWVEPMIKAGAVDPRREEAVPSWNRLASLAKVSTSTVTMMIDGRRAPNPRTVQKIANVLKVDPLKVSEWLELSRPVGRRYTAPPEADLLSERQQNALTTFIRALAADRRENDDAAFVHQKIDKESGLPATDAIEVDLDPDTPVPLTPPAEEESET